jgi:SAM-dependent methyltransferase
MAARKVFPGANYKMIDNLFDSSSAKGEVKVLDIVEKVDDISIDAAFLFEALDRSPDPTVLLERVKHALKPGGLCFITCLLSSGFEVQMLGEDSEVFVPPERMNLFSFEGMLDLVKKTGGLDVLELSTPGVLDIANVIKKLDQIENASFFNYILSMRQEPALIESFQDFLQLNCLGTFGRLVLRKL